MALWICSFAFLEIVNVVSCKNFHLGLMMLRGTRNWASYELQASAISIAVENAQRDGHFLNHTFTVGSRFVNDMSLSAGETVRMITEDKVDLLLGHPSSKRNLGAAYVTPYYNLPHISWGANDPTFEKKNIFRTFIRLSATFNKAGLAVAALFTKFNWNITAILIQATSDLCLHAMNGFLTKVTEYKIIVASFQRFDEDPSDRQIDEYLRIIKKSARKKNNFRNIMLRAQYNGMTSGDYVFIDSNFLSNDNLYRYRVWYNNDTNDVIAREAFRHVIHITEVRWYDESSKQRHLELYRAIPQKMTEMPWNDSIALDEGILPSTYSATLHDSMYLAVLWWDHCYNNGMDHRNGAGMFEFTNNLTYNGTSGRIHFDGNGDKQPMFWVEDLKNISDDSRIFGIVETYRVKSEMLTIWHDPLWSTPDGNAPPSTPLCGFANELCPPVIEDNTLKIILSLCGILVFVIAVIITGFYIRKRNYDTQILKMAWKINFNDISMKRKKRGIGSQLSALSLGDRDCCSIVTLNQNYTQTAEYNGQTVALKNSPLSNIQLTMKDLVELKAMRDFIHPNVNPFIGACIDPPNICFLFLYGTKGSLQDILENDDIKLEWVFKVAILKDIAKGMQYLHMSVLKSHGRLKSSNCIIDNRWTVKVTDYGVYTFYDNKTLANTKRNEDFKDLLWTSPEILRSDDVHSRNGTRTGDVYSYGIILHEMFYRCGPFPVAGKTPKDIIMGIHNGQSYKPDINKSDVIKTPMVKLMMMCWEDDWRQRPDFSAILSFIRENNTEASVSIIDNMINMLEKYANNLEDLVEERTVALNEEKDKTDLLLNRMLPKKCGKKMGFNRSWLEHNYHLTLRSGDSMSLLKPRTHSRRYGDRRFDVSSAILWNCLPKDLRLVADKLKRGESVDPEAFEAVTIFFSDIVGFTTIASQISPIDVVQFLNEIYTLFDDIISTFDVYKVETIGDAYMVVSGLPEKNGNAHSGQIGSMSLTILKQLKQFKLKAIPERQVMVRIGLHTGPVCAGVVGQTMPRYCLFGDTVNTASRMESNGEGGKIHITQRTRNALLGLGGYEIVDRGNVPIKGKGEMYTYWLVNKIDTTLHPSSSSNLDQNRLPSFSGQLRSVHNGVEETDGLST